MDRSPRRLLPLIVTITAMGVLAFSILVPALPELAEDLGVSRGAIGLVQSAVAVPGIFLAAFIGYLADRLGRRRVIRASLLIFGVAGLACFFARDFWLLVSLRFVQGLGTSGLLSLGVVVIGDLFTDAERRWAMGLNMAALTATTTLAPIAGGLLASGGTFWPFLVFALAFPVFFAARALPDGRTGVTAAPLPHLRAGLRELRGRGRLSDFLGMLPMSFLTLGIFLGLGLTVTPLYLDREFGLTVAQRGLVQAVGAASSSVVSVMYGRIAARFARTRILSVALVGMVAGFVVLATSGTLWQVGIGLAMLGSSTGSIFPLLQEYSASAGPAEYRGVLVGTWVSANRLGQTTGPAVGTAVADGLGERQAFGIAAVLMAAVAATWRPLRRVGRRAVPSAPAG
jgi:MFS family permease